MTDWQLDHVPARGEPWVPDLDVRVVQLTLPEDQGGFEGLGFLMDWLRPPAAVPQAPFAPDDGTKGAVRDLLRHGGHRPSGRGRPSSEYLQKAVGEGRIGPILPLVDLGNVVSLHSGLPISIVDRDKSVGARTVRAADPGAEYVFNRSGQVIQVGGLPCLHDGEGPCANAVKDAQRTKTDEDTRAAMALIWGTARLPERVAAATGWVVELARTGGVAAVEVPLP